VTLQELPRSVRTVDLEAIDFTIVLTGQAHVMEHGSGMSQPRIKSEASPSPGRRTKVIDAAGMVEQQRRLGTVDEPTDFISEFAIGDLHPFDVKGHCLSPG
jgi:hypothetical protein